MVRAIQRHWFLASLIVVLVIGILDHDRLRPVADLMPQDYAVASVLLVMSLGLKSRAMWNAVRRPASAALAVAVNLGVVPPLAWLAGRLLDPSLAAGMIVSAAVPCTQASAAVWTRRAGGNDTIAVLTTLVTSLACFVVTPAWLELLAGRTGGAGQGFGKLVVRLALVVAAPIVAGQLLRAFAPLRQWVTRHARGLSLYTQLGILSMVFVGAVECGKQIADVEGGVAPLAGQITLMLALVAAVHLAAWWFGFSTARLLGMSRADQAGVAFAGSQKTLMVGLAIAIDFGGLAVLPMVAYHIEQLLIDTVLADRLRRAKDGSTASI
jgi:solute carrier family 10 (sodium/bile acid cotransporter), member 7